MPPICVPLARIAEVPPHSTADRRSRSSVGGYLHTSPSGAPTPPRHQPTHDTSHPIMPPNTTTRHASAMCQQHTPQTARSSYHATLQHTTQRVARQRSNAIAACRRYAYSTNPDKKNVLRFLATHSLSEVFFIGLGHSILLVEIIFHTYLEFPALSVVLDV